MNKITFAGRLPNFGGERINKCYEIIVPAKTDNLRRLKTENFIREFGWKEIAVIPPLCKYTVEGHCSDDLHVLIEQALLGLKEPYIICDVENEGIRHACLQAESFTASDWENKGSVLSALGNLLVSYIGLYANRANKVSPVTGQISAEIERRLSDTMFSLENYIRQMPLNYDYVRKLYKKETGATPHEYLLGRRMELAQQLILSGISNQYSGYTVAQIAEYCGFTEPLYFSRVFKKYFGVSPSEYGK